MPLARALAGKSILVTGATGFLAKALVAKIARDLPESGRVVVLLRGRRKASGQVVTAAQRLEREVLGSSVFRRLRSELGDRFEGELARRIVAVEGDLTADGLGLSPADREVVHGVSAIVNSAATVVFDERLDLALAINTLGIRRLLALSVELGGIPVLHVSTAYACGRRTGLVREDLPHPTRAVQDDLAGGPDSLDLAREIAELEAIAARAREESLAPSLEARLRRHVERGEDRSLEDARKRWLSDRLVEAGMARARERGWNDTYTYTKSLGERVLASERGSIPACILRPSIIESAIEEPEPGWIDGLRMADPLFAAYGRGVLRQVPADPASVVDFVPVDHVVAAMLAALGRLLEGPKQVAELPVLHVATSDVNPLVFRSLVHFTHGYFLAHPLRDAKGRNVVPHDDSFVDEALFLRLVARRRRALDVAIAVLGRVPGRRAAEARARLGRARAQVDRLLYYVRIYGPYTSFPATFSTERTRELHASLSPEDKALLRFDPRSFDWATYIQDVHLPGLLRNVLREPAAGPMTHSSATAGEEPPAEGRTLTELIFAAAEEHASLPALRMHGGGTSITYGELLSRALGAALVLRDAGVGRGDRVVLQSENRPEWAVAYLGILAAGGVAVPLDAQFAPTRVRDIAGHVEAKALVLAAPRAVTGVTGTVIDIASLAAQPLPAARAAKEGLPVPVSAEQPASILFTSGTTLEPKGVVLPHRAFVANVEAIRELLKPSPEDRLVSVLPLHHAFEFTAGLMAPLAAGASITYLPAVSGPAVVEAMHAVRATCLLGVPRLYELMLEGIRRQMAEVSGGAGAALGALRGTSRALSAVGLSGAGRSLLAPLHARFGGAVRVLVSGGAALDPAVHDGFTELGFTLVEGYGLTECSPVLTVNPPEAARAGSVGRAVSGVELSIAHPGPDGVGEILARGPNVMSGYFRDPAATARVLREGWFHTGDLGRIEDGGYLRITGRLKDLIVTGAGKNVYPDEVESELGVVPGVRELCVVGIKARAGSGEEVHLVVVPEASTEAARAAIRDEVSRRMESWPAHQRVQRVHFQDEELPKTALMKVKRGQVRARLEGERPVAAAATTAVGARDADEAFVRQLLARLARVPEPSLGSDQNLAVDLGVDSLMLVELVAAIETRAGGKAPEGALKDLVTVRDLADLARSLEPAPGVATRVAPAPGAGPARASLIARTAAPLVRTAWPLFYGRYLGLRVEGRANLPSRGPYIVAANHQSHLDAGAILTAMGADSRRLHVVAARDYFFDTPWKGGFFAELLNAIPFDRQGDFERGMELCRAALAFGEPLLIFPEGTRSPDGRLQDFKAGVGVLAVGLGVPIVPTRIDGTHAALPKGAMLPRRHRVRVTFGAPLDARAIAPEGDALPYERWRAVAEAVRQRIVEMAPDEGTARIT